MKHKITVPTGIENFYSVISSFILPLLVKSQITPNKLTFLAGIIGFLGSFCLLLETTFGFICSALLIQISVILDAADGKLALKLDMQTKFGQWFDPYIDKMTDFVLILCLVIVLFNENDGIETVLLGMAMMGLVFITQFLMLFNDLLFGRYEESNARKISSSEKNNENVSFIMRLYRNLPGLGHAQFYFVTSIVIFLHGFNLMLDFIDYYLLYFAFYITITLGFITFIKISLSNIYNLGYKKNLE